MDIIMILKLACALVILNEIRNVLAKLLKRLGVHLEPLVLRIRAKIVDMKAKLEAKAKAKEVAEVEKLKAKLAAAEAKIVAKI